MGPLGLKSEILSVQHCSMMTFRQLLIKREQQNSLCVNSYNNSLYRQWTCPKTQDTIVQNSFSFCMFLVILITSAIINIVCFLNKDICVYTFLNEWMVLSTSFAVLFCSQLKNHLSQAQNELEATRRQLYDKKAEYNRAEEKIGELTADVGKWRMIANSKGSSLPRQTEGNTQIISQVIQLCAYVDNIYYSFTNQLQQ